MEDTSRRLHPRFKFALVLLTDVVDPRLVLVVQVRVVHQVVVGLHFPPTLGSRRFPKTGAGRLRIGLVQVTVVPVVFVRVEVEVVVKRDFRFGGHRTAAGSSTRPGNRQLLLRAAETKLMPFFE